MSLEDDLTAWGKVIVLETRGRRTGRTRRVAIGFVEADAGALRVAATDEAVHWAANLRADPHCVVEREGARIACRALELDGGARQDAVAALIVKYGAPAERLGGGPAFRLVPESPPLA
jgi:deazaflavin-dependent oxidoreductase (nitroreductase family)